MFSPRSNNLVLQTLQMPMPTSRWDQAKAYRRKVYQPPQIDPRADHSLQTVERDAEFWVNQLELAMSNLEVVKDAEGSAAKNMFLPDVRDPLLIEATCREIFLALIDRCQNGFRGPANFNKALKPHKGLEGDKTATCEERIKHVVTALTWNKRVCKDVLYEDWKIRLLVNHPLAYDKEKDSQKSSNDQRKRRLQAERDKLKKTEEKLLEYQLNPEAVSTSFPEEWSIYRGTGVLNSAKRPADEDNDGWDGVKQN